MRMQESVGRTFWVWYKVLDRRNGSLGWNPVGRPFNRRRIGDWVIAFITLWRAGDRRIKRG